MLDVLGLGVSDGVAVDDDELWEAMFSMGIRLIQPTIPVRNLVRCHLRWYVVVELTK